MQILSQELQRNIQEEAGKVPPEEIEKYYKDHADGLRTIQPAAAIRSAHQTKREVEVKNEDKNEKLSDEAQKAKEAEQKAKTEEGRAGDDQTGRKPAGSSRGWRGFRKVAKGSIRSRRHEDRISHRELADRTPHRPAARASCSVST